MRRIRGVLLAVVCLCSFACAQNQRGPSTPEERERFVTIAHKLEQAPLDTSLQKEREWALLWLIQVPDVHVKMCTAALGNFLKSKYKYSSEITIQLTFSSGAFVIEHPDKADDDLAQYVAGAEGALKAYQAILAAHPDAKSKELDQLLEKQAQGQLTDFVRESSKKSCK